MIFSFERSSYYVVEGLRTLQTACSFRNNGITEILLAFVSRFTTILCRETSILDLNIIGHHHKNYWSIDSSAVVCSRRILSAAILSQEQI